MRAGGGGGTGVYLVKPSLGGGAEENVTSNLREFGYSRGLLRGFFAYFSPLLSGLSTALC